MGVGKSRRLEFRRQDGQARKTGRPLAMIGQPRSCAVAEIAASGRFNRPSDDPVRQPRGHDGGPRTPIPGLIVKRLSVRSAYFLERYARPRRGVCAYGNKWSEPHFPSMLIEPPRPSPTGVPTPQPPFPKVPPERDEPPVPDVPVREPDEEVDDTNPPRPADLPIESPEEGTNYDRG